MGPGGIDLPTFSDSVSLLAYPDKFRRTNVPPRGLPPVQKLPIREFVLAA